MKTIVEANLYNAADELLDAEFIVQARRRDRDHLIRKAAPEMTLQAIGDMVGLTRAAVGLIVKAGASQPTTTGAGDAPTA
jgi:hypothetical protein